MCKEPTLMLDICVLGVRMLNSHRAALSWPAEYALCRSIRLWEKIQTEAPPGNVLAAAIGARSLSGEPIAKEPTGTTIMSGQAAHSLNVSCGFNARSRSTDR